MFKTVLGFDFGLKKIGVAVGQHITATASPVTILTAQEGKPNWQTVSDLIKLWRPEALLVGVPVQMDGSRQALTDQAEHFIIELKSRFQQPVLSVDERLTTRMARLELFERGNKHSNQCKVDAYAACLIVESWLKEQQAQAN